MDSLKVEALQDRYPGLRSFNSNEQTLFFGRKKEIDDLVDLVRAEQITVLFSKSGLGKSSLLNAGLTPKLTALNYQVIPVRFQKQKAKADDNDSAHLPPPLSDNVLLNIVLTQLHGEFRAAWHGQKRPNTANRFYSMEPRRLWEEVKTHPFPNGAVPVFIFDQFEEMFIYDQAQRDTFMRQLAELMNDQSPARIIKWLLQTDVDDRTLEMMDWSKQPLVKCLFSIRADRLFEMHKLRVMIPMILRNRYELLPLEDDRAREAIDKPAQADGEFTTPKFTYLPATREFIIRVLSGQKKMNSPESTDEGVEVCEIESSQLQIVCNYIENKIKEKVARGEDPIVGADIIHDEQSINRILDKFYRTQLKQIGSAQEIDKVRLVLENDLIVDGHRVGLAAAKMRKSLGDDEAADRLIDKLIEVRLIRADDTHLGRTYELSHDTLIEPVEKVKQLRTALQNRIARRKEAAEQFQKLREQELKLAQERTKKNQLFVAVVVAVVATLLALYFLVNGRINLAQANSDWAADEYAAGNQRMAYRLWESSRALLRLIPGLKATLADKRADYMMVPFAGATTQITFQDTNIHYVASLFQNNMFEVWQSSDDHTAYEKIDSLYKEQGKPQINAMSATQLQLRNNYLIVFKHDSLLQVFDLARKEKVFPQQTDYYPLLTSHALVGSNKALNEGNTVVYSTQTVVLPPKGNWLATLDCHKHAHLYDLKRNCSPHHFFETLTNRIPGFSLDSLEFSSSEDFLLVNYPGHKRYDLLNLRTQQPPTPYINTAYAHFSPTGKYLITLSTIGQLAISDVVTKKTLMAVLLPKMTSVADLIFNRDESALVLVAEPEEKQTSPNKRTYELFRIDLIHSNPSLKSIAQNVSAYRPFGWAGHVLYTSGSLSHNYNMATDSDRLFSFSLHAVTQTGTTSLLYKRPESAGKNLYLYNIVTGNHINVSRLSSGINERFAFYAPPGEADETLVQVTPERLTFFKTIQLESATIDKPDFLEAQGTTTFQPASLTISGPIIRVKNQDDVVLCFFVDNRKNQLDYIVNSIYPELSAGDRDAAGLPN